MEDITTTANAYSKDELAAFSRHMVVFEVEYICEAKEMVDAITGDSSKSRDQIKLEIQALFDAMRLSWYKIGPARVLARKLYPHLNIFFDILDKSLSIQDALEDMRTGTDFRKEEPCNLSCCKKVFKPTLEGNGNAKDA